jgi:pyruvate formate lyase activating enzyme
MILGGFQKTTLIDYPGKIATTVFTVGCNFRCPFCHNPELILGSRLPEFDKMEKVFLTFLKTRQDKLDGVCITGGEPTIQPDIIDFVKKIKKMGFAVKLDTNGMRPDVLKKLLDLKLLDFVAMDIKNCQKNYAKTVGGKVDLERIKLSVEMIRHCGLPYEFRTTVVPGIHTEKDFLAIANWLQGSERYFLQEYREGKILDEKLKKKTRGQKMNLEKIRKNIEKSFVLTGIRN